jgi:hypothetical protein
VFEFFVLLFTLFGLFSLSSCIKISKKCTHLSQQRFEPTTLQKTALAQKAHHYDRDMDCYKLDINFYCFSVKIFEFKIRLN